MEVLDRGLDRAMPHQELNGAGIDASIEQMGGKAVSQSMDTPALFDASPSAGPVVNLLRGATGHGSFAFGVWEEPGPWALDFQIGAQFGQQALGKQGVAVFVALALVDADEHAARVTLDILELELDDFADP